MQGFIKLTISGDVVAGYNSVTEMGGDDLSEFIQIESFDFGLSREEREGARQKYLTVTKHMDQATPRISEAIFQNSTCEVTLWIYEPSEDGTTQRALEVIATQGRVVSSVCDGIRGEDPPTESVAFNYGNLELNHLQASISASLDFSQTV